MHFFKKLIKKRNIKRVSIAITIALLIILLLILVSVDLKNSTLFDIILLPVTDKFYTGKITGTSGEIKKKKNFDAVIKYINKFNPQVTFPSSFNFEENDTTNKPKKNSLGDYIQKGDNIGTGNNDIENWSKASYNYLSNNFLILNDDIKKNVINSHSSIIESLNSTNSLPYLGESYYNGNGIVLVGGGDYSLMVFAVIKVIRATGTTLPIEVVIPDLDIKKSDIKFCSLIQDYNSSCVFLKNHFNSKVLKESQFEGFQYKSLALLVSSFQNVLLLDADDYPVMMLDDIFDHKSFKDTGMIVWPDMWRRTTHPFFYESANITINFEKRERNFIDSFSNMRTYVPEGIDLLTDVPYHDFAGALPDPASETGQFMIDKKKHWKSLILSFYYNTFGPNVYYHLMTQYSAGQGDKETFIAAAHMLDLPYYQVLSTATMDGYHQQDGSGFKSTAYYQKDFRNDYEIKSKLLTLSKDNNIININNNKDIDKDYNPLKLRETLFSATTTEEYAMFAHCNFPKFNPLELTSHMEFVWNENHFRALTKKKCLVNIDLEKVTIGSYHEILCENGKQPLEQLITDFKKVDKKQVCQYLKDRLEYLTNNR